MNPHFFTAPFYFAFIWFKVQGSGFKVQGSWFKVQGSWFKVQRVQKVQRAQRGWCGAFRHPERRKKVVC